jgi:hypothetical protein
MEFAQYHGFQPKSIRGITADLHAALRPGYLHRRASLGVVARGPWRPADLWEGALERLVWTVGIESAGGPLLSEAGETELGRSGLARRKAPIHPVELLAQRAGEGLVLVHSDAAQLAYVAVYRERHLSWSLLLQDRVRLVRCDGQVVLVDEPPRYIAEVDRAGVLLAGLRQWLREPVEIADTGRLTLADTLAELTGEEPPEWIVRDGAWIGDHGEQGRGRAAMG